MTEFWIVLGALLLIAFLASLVFRATRLDRLHNDVLRSRSTLERLLASRAHLALDMVALGEFDPASAMIVADAATRALDDQRQLVPDGLGPDPVPESALGFAETRDRAVIESELSHVLRDVLDDPESRRSDLATRLLDTWERIVVARGLHDQKVELTRRLRSRLFVRIFRLAGRAPLPVPFEMDDRAP